MSAGRGPGVGADLWVDAGAGVAGDMLLAALLDAGADPTVVRAAVAAVLPGEVELDVTQTTRAGLRARRVEVRQSGATDPPERSWATIRQLLSRADLTEQVRRDATATFTLLAQAEAHVHGTEVDRVHFHEVGSWDSIADIVGVCAALTDLVGTRADGAPRIGAGPVALGHGRVRTAHGSLPVPAPAVLELCRRAQVPVADGPPPPGECATPTGVALLAALVDTWGHLPPGVVAAVGVGAGGRDPAGHPNVTRVVLTRPPAGSAQPPAAALTVLECTVDDLDPRVWPTVLAGLLDLGARDAWLTPVLMKKGRPGHVLTALVEPGLASATQELMLRHTPTLGVRSHPVTRVALPREHVNVQVDGGQVRVKLGRLRGEVVTATPELEDCLALARARGVPVADVLAAASAAARSGGLLGPPG